MTKYRGYSLPRQIPTNWLSDNQKITLDMAMVEKQMERLQGFVEMQQIYRGAIQEIATKLEILDDEFRVRYAHNPIHHIDNRMKSAESILAKMKRKNLEISLKSIRENVLDLAGVRVVCNYIEDIYQVASMLVNQSDLILVRRRDYIAAPKENGYRSLHLVVKIPVFLSDRTEMVPVEVQIRTIAMDFWASLEHELHYKAPAEVSDALQDRLKACAEASANLDNEMQAIRRLCLGSAAGADTEKVKNGGDPHAKHAGLPGMAGRPSPHPGRAE